MSALTQHYTRDEFAQHAARFGFEPSDYLRPFDWTDGTYRLVGLNPRARTYPCIAERIDRPDDRAYAFVEKEVREQFENGGYVWPNETT